MGGFLSFDGEGVLSDLSLGKTGHLRIRLRLVLGCRFLLLLLLLHALLSRCFVVVAVAVGLLAWIYELSCDFVLMHVVAALVLTLELTQVELASHFTKRLKGYTCVQLCVQELYPNTQSCIHRPTKKLVRIYTHIYTYMHIEAIEIKAFTQKDNQEPMRGPCSLSIAFFLQNSGCKNRWDAHLGASKRPAFGAKKWAFCRDLETGLLIALDVCVRVLQKSFNLKLKPHLRWCSWAA